MKNGGPAFPVHGNYFGDKNNPGMSLQDFFAAKADISWEIAVANMKEAGNKEPSIAEIFAYRASMKYAQANAMLEEREKWQK